MNFTFAEIASIIEGTLVKSGQLKEQYISRICTDSRTCFNNSDALFFALTGPRNNGHSYIPDLIEKGIRAFVVSERKFVQSGADFIIVNDTTSALQKLATFVRHQFNYPVVGITGSNGKTIVKEWLNEILSTKFKIVRSPKSYNSQVGVPLSVLLMDNHYNLAVFEAGISLPGEMERLAKIIKPEIGIFTNIGDAHQENFDSLQQKISEKLLLFKNSKKLVYCADDTENNSLIEEFCNKNSIEKISWSLFNNPAKLVFSADIQNDFTEVNTVLNQNKAAFKIPFTDGSSIENACHCFAVATVLCDETKSVLPFFEKLTSLEMRLEIKKGINHCLLVNDYYNSDLHSLSGALSVLHMQAAKEHRFKQVILSDIQQTGLETRELYSKVNELLVEWKIDEIFGIGPEISANPELFSIKKTFFASTADFTRHFNRDLFNESAILIKGARHFAFEKISEVLQQKAHQTQFEINLNALVHNLNTFRGILKPGTKVMVMVKAFSYGSGDVEVAKMLQYQNVDYLAVAVTDEGVLLRNAGIQTPIVVMNPEMHSFQHLMDYQLEPNIYSAELLRDIERTVSLNAVTGFPVHIKLDTGMNRLGIKSESELDEIIQTVNKSDTLKIKSVFSHLSASDDPDFDAFTKSQIARFRQLSDKIILSFNYKIERHILNSAGIERFAEHQFEMVRLGIGLYGISTTGLPLLPIGTLKSTVSQVKSVSTEETVGYSRRGKVSKHSEIAVIPMGYADGLDRKLGNGNGQLFIRGKKVPVIGNICMDMLMIDVTGLNVKVGDSVEIFGQNISVTEVAEKAGTIPYEILTGISQRVKRVYLQE